MPISPDDSRALLRDPDIPTEQLVRWVDDPRPEPAPTKPPRPWKTWIGLGTTATFLLGVGVMGASAGPETPRLAQPGCIFHTVQPGENVWRIAGAAGITLDVAARLNPQIENLSLVHPGDQIATSCGTNEVQRAQVQASSRAVTKYATETCYKNPNESLSPEKRQPYECWTWGSIVTALHKAGFRGDDLVTMAALSVPEGGRAVDPCTTPQSCDRTLADGTYGESVGTFQIRTMFSADNTGGPRDRFALRGNLEHQAWAAHEIYLSSLVKRSKGQTIVPVSRAGEPKKERRLREAFDDWSAYQLDWHLGVMDTARAAATKAGLL